MSIFNVFSLLGGLAMFLYGMDIMGGALERLAGSRMSKIMEKLTSNPFKGFLLGLVVTAVIQSSSATTVMVVGFVNSGIMTLSQAIGVIMGSNVGTTVTAWILSLSGISGESFLMKMLKPSSFSPVLAFIGILIYMSGKDDKKKNTGSVLLGFAILMTGMENMSRAVRPLSERPWFARLFIRFQNPLLGLMAGAVLTAVIQSSSASVGILQALSSTGAITFGSAIPIILGQNIGTCVTALLSSVGAGKNAKRTAIAHLYFNIIGAAICMAVIYTLNFFHPLEFMQKPIDRKSIAIVHSLFNITAAAIMLPLSSWLEKLAVKTIKGDNEEDEFRALDTNLLFTPVTAVKVSENFINKMADISLGSFLSAINFTDSPSRKEKSEIEEAEIKADKYEDKLGSYLVRVSGQDLSARDSKKITRMLTSLSDLERISDYSVQLSNAAMEQKDKNTVFSRQAQGELNTLKAALYELITTTLSAFKQNNIEEAGKVEPLKNVTGELIDTIKKNHIERLRNKECTIEQGFILSDMLNSYERRAGHCSNIAIAVLQEENAGLSEHVFADIYKSDPDSDFRKEYTKQKEKYLIPDLTLKNQKI